MAQVKNLFQKTTFSKNTSKNRVTDASAQWTDLDKNFQNKKVVKKTFLKNL
jgi:hypothetical protein